MSSTSNDFPDLSGVFAPQCLRCPECGAHYNKRQYGKQPPVYAQWGIENHRFTEHRTGYLARLLYFMLDKKGQKIFIDAVANAHTISDP